MRLALIMTMLVTAPAWAEPIVEVDGAQMAAALKPRAGRAKVIHLWASWCGPCLEELPELVQVLKGLEARPLDVVFVTLDPRAKLDVAVKVLAEAGGAPGASLRASDAAIAVLRRFDRKWTGAIPTTFVLSPAGELRGVSYGATDLDALRETIDRVAPAPRFRLKKRSG